MAIISWHFTDNNDDMAVEYSADLQSNNVFIAVDIWLDGSHITFCDEFTGFIDLKKDIVLTGRDKLSRSKGQLFISQHRCIVGNGMTFEIPKLVISTLYEINEVAFNNRS